MTSLKEKSRHFNDIPGIQNGGTWLDFFPWFSLYTPQTSNAGNFFQLHSYASGVIYVIKEMYTTG
jgi:hypothetical protein